MEEWRGALCGRGPLLIDVTPLFFAVPLENWDLWFRPGCRVSAKKNARVQKH